MQKLLTFDVGTTAMKCILFDENFKQLFFARCEYDISTPSERIAELDPEIYFSTFLECVNKMRESGIDTREISSITFTTQGETLIPVDRDGRPLTSAIVWLDTRAEKEAEYLRELIGDGEIYRHTGLWGIDGALPSAKVLWLSKNKPEIYERLFKLLLVEDYLIYRLTGRFVSEASLQSSTGWYDINGETLFSDMASACGIRGDMLPEILPCATVVGKPFDEFGFGENTVVTTGAMDQISSAVGIGNIREGIFSETTGTALVVGITVEKPVYDTKTPITVYKHYDGKFIYMPYYSTAGMALKWFRDTLMPYAEEEGRRRGLSAYEYIDTVAEKSPAGCRGTIMLPSLSHGGGFLGITLTTDISDMARSVLEAVAYTLRGIIELAEARGIKIDEVYSLGGGSKSLLWGRIKADVCQKSFIPVDFPETTALGAAVLASVSIGIYESVEAALSHNKISGRVICAQSEDLEAYDENYKKFTKYIQEDQQ